MTILTNDQVEDLLNKSMKQIEDYPSLRHGQALMNELFNIDRDLYTRIQEEDINDPFYNDDKVYKFLEAVSEDANFAITIYLSKSDELSQLV